MKASASNRALVLKINQTTLLTKLLLNPDGVTYATIKKQCTDLLIIVSTKIGNGVSNSKVPSMPTLLIIDSEIMTGDPSLVLDLTKTVCEI